MDDIFNVFMLKLTFYEQNDTFLRHESRHFLVLKAEETSELKISNFYLKLKEEEFAKIYFIPTLEEEVEQEK